MQKTTNLIIDKFVFTQLFNNLTTETETETKKYYVVTNLRMTEFIKIYNIGSYNVKRHINFRKPVFLYYFNMLISYKIK